MAQEGVDSSSHSGSFLIMPERGGFLFRPRIARIVFLVLQEWVGSSMVRALLHMHRRLFGLILFFFRREE
jgi:hypothetical protein